MARTVSTSAADAKGATAGFTPLPAGDYIVEIIDVEEGVYGPASANSGKPKLTVQYKVVEPEEFAGRKFKDFSVPLFPKWTSGKVAFIFYQFFKALGVEFNDDGDTDLPENEDLWEQTIGVKLGVEPKNSDPSTLQNKVQGYFDPSKGVQTAPKEDGAGAFSL